MISEVTKFLEEAYNVLNEKYFDGLLPIAVITIQSTPKAYGHITTGAVWQDGDIGYHELNIAAEHLDRPIEQVLATLVHEQTHLKNIEDGVKDVSRGGTYHNKKFKATAEATGLVEIAYAEKIGWSVTTPTQLLVDFIEEQGWSGVQLARQTPSKTGKGKTSSTRKYQCPLCGCSVRATKEVRIGCLDCEVEMIEVVK